ncbi:MAG: hypothetical protein WCI51_20060 [Lentisphaerota bacterium]
MRAIISLYFLLAFSCLGEELYNQKVTHSPMSLNLPKLNEINKIELSNKPMCLSPEKLFFVHIDNIDTISKIYNILNQEFDIYENPYKSFIVFRLTLILKNGKELFWDFYKYHKNNESVLMKINDLYFIVPIVDFSNIVESSIDNPEEKQKFKHWLTN